MVVLGAVDGDRGGCGLAVRHRSDVPGSALMKPPVPSDYPDWGSFILAFDAYEESLLDENLQRLSFSISLGVAAVLIFAVLAVFS